MGVFPDERTLVRQVTRYWWLPLASGVAWLLIGWLVLRMNETSVATVGVLIGIVLLFAGLTQVAVAMLAPAGWRIWHYVMAFIFLLGGLWGFIRPVNTFFALASVLGLILVFYGTFEIFQAVAFRAVNPYWWLGLISGVALLLLAFLVSGSDRVYALQQRSYLILFWVGFFSLFRGFSLIMLAFGLRHAGRDAEHVADHVAGLP